MPTAKKSRLHRTESMQKPSSGRDQYFSRAVSKALEALELLQAQEQPMALHEISRRIQLSKTSTFRLLCTLESAGWLVSGEWGRYALGPTTHSVVSTQSLRRLLRAGVPHLQNISRDLHETASLAALFDNRVEVIAVVESPQPIRMSNVVGHIVPPNASSLGKAIISFLPEDRREKLIRSYGIYRFTGNTITDRGELDREFERVREQRFALDREESVCDGNCFGAPIFAGSGQVCAAISISLPKARVRDSAHETKIIEMLQAAAEQTAAALRKTEKYRG